MSLKDTGEARLLRLGLQQEFKREFTLLTNFGISFSIISVLTGIGGSLSIAWNNGGPLAAVYGWKLVSAATLCIGLSMGEVVSGLPSSGGPYFWSSWLAGSHGPLASWITGWLNLLGQIAVTASIASCAMLVLNAMVSMLSGYALSTFEQLGVYGGVLLLAALINSTPPRILARVIAFSIFWHFSGVIVLVLLLPTIAPSYQSARFVWATFFDHTLSPNHITNDVYLFLQGCLMAQFTIIGYDSCAHMSEETKGADSNAPVAIVLSIAGSAVLGYILLIGMLVAIQDPFALTDATKEAAGFAPGQLLWDVFKQRFGRGTGGAITLIIFLVAMLLCTTASITANSRMIFAFARDRGVPFSRVFKRISPRTTTPIHAVWLAATCAFILGTPLLKSSVAFTAIVSISSMGLQLSYGIPIFFRLTVSRKTFERGPFHLGRFSDIIGWLSVSWILFSAVLFTLPTSFPVTLESFNYASVALGAVLAGCITAWFLPSCGARHWYQGPKAAMDNAAANDPESRQLI